MDNKISIDDVVNTNELPLVHYLECPIDNMISMAPIMCKKCETCFCQDCIENWKKKSNVCPMRCNPIELMPVEKTILKQQLEKIRLACPNVTFGCLSRLLVKERELHEKTCEYKGVKCEKCQEIVPMIGMLYHLYESCKKNTVSCFICNSSLNLNNFLSHLEKCDVKSSVCQTCIQPILDDNLHSKKCNLKLALCQSCKLPDLQSELLNGNHICLNDYDLINLNTYLKSVQTKYEVSINEIIAKHEEKYKEFSKKFADINNELIKRENEKLLKLDNKYVKQNDEYIKKMYGIKKEKREGLNILNLEIQDLQRNIESKIIVYLKTCICICY